MDGNLKLILGLIWTLILHYSISMPMWDDEDDEETKKLTPKQRLLGWIQNKVPQLPINNFNRDWRDGKALGALVDNCAPGKELFWRHPTLEALMVEVLNQICAAHFLWLWKYTIQYKTIKCVKMQQYNMMF